MNFLLIFCLFPRILSQHWVNPFKDGLWDLKDTYEIRGNSLGNSFYKDFSSCLEINFSFQPITQLDILLWTSLKVLTLDFPPTIGKPKYFSQSIKICAPNIPWIAFLFSCRVLQLKNKYVVCRFIAWLKASSCCAKIFSKIWYLVVLASLKMRLSSTKNKWDILTPPLQEVIPLIWCDLVAFRNRDDRPSTHYKNRYEEVGVETDSISKLTHWFANPIFNIMFQRKSHSTRSYAFLMSNFISICPTFPLNLFCIWCNIS